MRKWIVALILLSALSVVAETPQEGAAAILSLLKERNYTELFTTRYTEWYKAEAEGVPQEAAVKKLSSLMERGYDQMVEVFTGLSTAEFEFSTYDLVQQTETGETATATVILGEKQIPYTLYKMKNGLWGFHL